MMRGAPHRAPFSLVRNHHVTCTGALAIALPSVDRLPTDSPSSPTLAGVTVQSAADLWGRRFRAAFAPTFRTVCSRPWFGAARPGRPWLATISRSGCPTSSRVRGSKGTSPSSSARPHVRRANRLGIRPSRSSGTTAERAEPAPAIRRHRRSRPLTSRPAHEPPSARRGARHHRLPAQVHLRLVRHRVVQPLLARRGRWPSPRRPARPTTRLLIHGGTGARQRRTCCRRIGAVTCAAHHPHLVPRYVTSETFFERVRRGDPRQAPRRVQAALPGALRRPAGRRRAVPRRQGALPGGVLPHVQHAL